MRRPCQPPVPGTVHLPTTAPFGPSSRNSMVPPPVAEVTCAVNDFAPVPKAAPLTLIQSPFSIQPTFMPSSLERSVSTPVAHAIVSASWRTYGLRTPTCGARPWSC
jgi:hypothetical protein